MQFSNTIKVTVCPPPASPPNILERAVAFCSNLNGTIALFVLLGAAILGSHLFGNATVPTVATSPATTTVVIVDPSAVPARAPDEPEVKKAVESDHALRSNDSRLPRKESPEVSRVLSAGLATLRVGGGRTEVLKTVAGGEMVAKPPQMIEMHDVPAG